MSRYTSIIIMMVIATALAACSDSDSTDVSGDYDGNATYTASTAGSATATLSGAQRDAVTLANISDSSVGVRIGASCELVADQLHQSTVEDHSAETRFVFASETLAAGQGCTLALGGQPITVTISEGDLIVDAGGTITLELGGTTAAGYLVYNFAGAD